jgi:hypothetical protein
MAVKMKIRLLFGFLCAGFSVVGSIAEEHKEAILDQVPVAAKPVKHEEVLHTHQLVRKPAAITKVIIEQEHQRFSDYVFSMRRQVNYCAETILFKGAKFRGYNDFSCKCIPISYGFFAHDEYMLKRILRNISVDRYVNYICVIVDRYLHELPRDKNSLSRILHEEHVKNITLSADINKKELMAKPDLYKKLIDQKKINLDERDAFVAAGLFAQYWLEKKGYV